MTSSTTVIKDSLTSEGNTEQIQPYLSTGDVSFAGKNWADVDNKMASLWSDKSWRTFRRVSPSIVRSSYFGNKVQFDMSSTPDLYNGVVKNIYIEATLSQVKTASNGVADNCAYIPIGAMVSEMSIDLNSESVGSQQDFQRNGYLFKEIITRSKDDYDHNADREGNQFDIAKRIAVNKASSSGHKLRFRLPNPISNASIP